MVSGKDCASRMMNILQRHGLVVYGIHNASAPGKIGINWIENKASNDER